MATVAERFESIRMMLHLNRGQFADFLGITGSMIGAMEKGTAPVSRKTTARLMDRLSINPIWLQYGVGEMFTRSDISLETILDGNPALKTIYDAWTEKKQAEQRKTEKRLEKAAARIVRYKNTAERMRTFRTYVQINQNQLAKRLGVSRELISAIEREKKLISEHMAARIEKEFGISSAWLLDGTGEMVLAGGPVQMQIEDLVSEKNGYQMLAWMICALTDKMKAGDWETLNAVYAELANHQDTHCELMAG